jgi:hypothetical protein
LKNTSANKKDTKNPGARTMNIFEDLIEELKDADLIEQTVIETSLIEEQNKASEIQAAKAETESIGDQFNNAQGTRQNTISEQSTISKNVSSPTAMNAAPEYSSIETPEFAAPEILVAEVVEEPIVVDEMEFYRERAKNEVAFLQTVEAAFAGVEREQLKIVPRQFDDLKVKKVLHSFLQITGDANSPEYSKAEFQLLKETESWYSSLSLRDMRVMTAHLRRYCETTRPQLSSPALVALARFYRNSPYSELIRSKFDLVATRLFSKEVGANKRETVFSRAELTTHLQELYADWSSVPLYSTEENDQGIAHIAQKFEDFMAEAESAQSFDELIESNFFNRLRQFKEQSSENFYAPAVAARAIECNVRVGNLYVDLLEKEKGKGNVSALEDKYGLSHDQTISEATGKTLSLVELLKQKNEAPKPAVAEKNKEKIKERNTVVIEPIVAEKNRDSEKGVKTEPKAAAVKSKKWMFSVALLALFIIGGIYFATKSEPVKVQETSSVPKMNLENSMLKEYLLEATVQDATLNGVVSPAWNHFTVEKKKDALKQMLTFGDEKGYKKVKLATKDNKPVATAADGEIVILD